MRSSPTGHQRGLSQVEASRYLGVSVRWFREHVNIEPVPFGPVLPDRRPLMRYLKEDLDSLISAWASRRSA